MEYKAFLEEDKNTFHTQMPVYFSQCNTERVLSLHELLKITSDVAVEDYNQLGLPRDFLKEKGFGILVSRCSYRIHNCPKENQIIEVVTWEEKPEALQLMRGYKILDEKGNILISGKSSWIVVDIKERKIIPSKNFTLRNPPSVSLALDCDNPKKIIQPENMTLWDTRKIKISDMDANGHTNNSRYAAFIEDALPEEYRKKQVKDFKINFAKEAVLEDPIELYGFIEKDKITVVGKTPKATSFEASLSY